MSLVTRCAACATTFRVSPAQLSARAGRVRCGKCAAVFDGVSNLLTDEAIEALPEEPSPQLGLFEAREAGVELPDAGTIAAAEITAPIADLPRPVPSIAALMTADARPEAPVSEPAARLTPRRTAPDSPGTTPEPVPAFLQRPSRAPYTLVWSLLALIALAAGAGQAILHFRTEIAVLAPQTRIHIETACEMLGCELRLPRRAELMSIESSDLQADTRRPGVIVLNALLRNRAPFEQDYPDLELTLTDERDQPVIRRVLGPPDYVRDRGAAGAKGIGAGAEESVRVHFDTSRVRATGYRLYLFYR